MLAPPTLAIGCDVGNDSQILYTVSATDLQQFQKSLDIYTSLLILV